MAVKPAFRALGGDQGLAGVWRTLVAPSVAAVLLLTSVSPAVACTRPLWNRPFDPAAASLVAEGWIERIVVRPDLYSHELLTMFVPIDVVIRSEAAHRGQVPSLFAFTESASLAADIDTAGNVRNQRWSGSAGACGLFDSDPTGLYILVALQEDTGSFLPNFIQTVGIGRGPGDPMVVRLRQEIQAAPPPRESARIVPAVTSPERGPAPWILSVVPLPLALAALVAVGGALGLTATGVAAKAMYRRRRRR